MTKADGDLLKLAMSTASDYSGALHITRASYGTQSPHVVIASSKTVDGVFDVWKHICEFRKMLVESGDINKRRNENSVYWMWRHLKDMIETRTRSDKTLQKQALMIEKQLLSETIPPRTAARMLFENVIIQEARKVT